MGFEHQFPYGDVNELNLDWIIQTMQEFINSEREAGHTPTVSGVKSFFTHKYPYGSIHELNLDWVIQTALRMEEIGDSVDGDIGELKTRMTAAEANISALENTVGGLSDSISQIETEIEDIQGDVEDLQATAAQHTTQIAALDAKIDAQVVANPADAATDTLSKIEIAGTVYGVEGSGGSEVEANPTGEPTDTLQKIGIDGTIYEVGGSSEPVSKTVTGNPISITDAADAPIVSGEVTFEPVQNLHGYVKPWAGGAGKNKLPMTVNGIKAANASGTWSGNDYTYNSAVFTIQTDDDGNVTGIKVNGTPSLDTYFYFGNINFNGSYKVSGYQDSIYSRISVFVNNSVVSNIDNDDAPYSLTVTSSDTVNISIKLLASRTFTNNIVSPIVCLPTETDPTFEPYSNICPITGYTDCEVEVTDDVTTPTTTNTYTIDLDGTRYGGTVDLVSGEMRVDRAIVDFDGSDVWIASQTTGRYVYNVADGKLGEEAYEYVKTSHYPYGASEDNDVYWCDNANSVLRIIFNASFATKADWLSYLTTQNTYGTPLQICYPLATPFTVQLTPEQIRTLQGTNSISTNMTSMSVEYITQDYQPLVKLIERSAGHHYSSQERVVGTWIDGKPLYEKTVVFENQQLTVGSNVLSLGITNTDLIFPVGVYITNSSKTNIRPLNSYDTGQNTESLFYRILTNTREIDIQAGVVWASPSIYITLQYTKTTD